MLPGYSMTVSFVRQIPSSSSSESAPDVAISTEMIRFAGGLPLSRRRVRFEDENSESSREGPEAALLCVSDEEDVESIVSSTFDEKNPPIFISRIRDLALVRSHCINQTDRVKIYVGVTYLILSRLAGYLLLGYAFVLLTGMDAKTLIKVRGSIDNFDPNNIILDLLPLPIVSLQRYLRYSQDETIYNTTSSQGLYQQTEDFLVNSQDRISDVGTTSTQQPQHSHTSTNVAYIDWIDRALGWKGVGH